MGLLKKFSGLHNKELGKKKNVTILLENSLNTFVTFKSSVFASSVSIQKQTDIQKKLEQCNGFNFLLSLFNRYPDHNGSDAKTLQFRRNVAFVLSSLFSGRDFPQNFHVIIPALKDILESSKYHYTSKKEDKPSSSDGFSVEERNVQHALLSLNYLLWNQSNKLLLHDDYGITLALLSPYFIRQNTYLAGLASRVFLSLCSTESVDLKNRIIFHKGGGSFFFSDIDDDIDNGMGDYSDNDSNDSNETEIGTNEKKTSKTNTTTISNTINTTTPIKTSTTNTMNTTNTTNTTNPINTTTNTTTPAPVRVIFPDLLIFLSHSASLYTNVYTQTQIIHAMALLLNRNSRGCRAFIEAGGPRRMVETVMLLATGGEIAWSRSQPARTYEDVMSVEKMRWAVDCLRLLSAFDAEGFTGWLSGEGVLNAKGNATEAGNTTSPSPSPSASPSPPPSPSSSATPSSSSAPFGSPSPSPSLPRPHGALNRFVGCMITLLRQYSQIVYNASRGEVIDEEVDAREAYVVNNAVMEEDGLAQEASGLLHDVAAGGRPGVQKGKITGGEDEEKKKKEKEKKEKEKKKEKTEEEKKQEKEKWKERERKMKLEEEKEKEEERKRRIMKRAGRDADIVHMDTERDDDNLDETYADDHFDEDHHHHDDDDDKSQAGSSSNKTKGDVDAERTAHIGKDMNKWREGFERVAMAMTMTAPHRPSKGRDEDDDEEEDDDDDGNQTGDEKGEGNETKDDAEKAKKKKGKADGGAEPRGGDSGDRDSRSGGRGEGGKGGNDGNETVIIEGLAELEYLFRVFSAHPLVSPVDADTPAWMKDEADRDDRQQREGEEKAEKGERERKKKRMEREKKEKKKIKDGGGGDLQKENETDDSDDFGDKESNNNNKKKKFVSLSRFSTLNLDRLRRRILRAPDTAAMAAMEHSLGEVKTDLALAIAHLLCGTRPEPAARYGGVVQYLFDRVQGSMKTSEEGGRKDERDAADEDADDEDDVGSKKSGDEDEDDDEGKKKKKKKVSKKKDKRKKKGDGDGDSEDGEFDAMQEMKKVMPDERMYSMYLAYLGMKDTQKVIEEYEEAVRTQEEEREKKVLEEKRMRKMENLKKQGITAGKKIEEKEKKVDDQKPEQKKKQNEDL